MLLKGILGIETVADGPHASCNCERGNVCFIPTYSRGKDTPCEATPVGRWGGMGEGHPIR